MYTLRAVVALLILTFQVEKRLEFEVASIKPAAPDARGRSIRPSPGGRVTISNMPLKELMTLAWRIQPYQIVGGPPWLDSAAFDISAKAQDTLKEGDMQLLLQSLIEDRFQVVHHKETRELPIYALVVARKDGRLGPKLTETKEGGCTTLDPARPQPPPEPGQPLPRNCGQMQAGLKMIRAVGIQMSLLTPMLSRLLGRTVVDKTGLTGKYDLDIEWTFDEAIVLQLPPDVPKPVSDGSGPSIFTALQEQLGLKLESQKGPVEVLVIDRAEKPTEN
jgi:uncharacterized protein (TIGR03435 family)